MILRGPQARRRPALEIVTSVRLPEMGERTGGGAFDAAGDVTVECDCGWHAMGPREQMKGAVAEHRRMWHSQAVDPIVTKLNMPRA